jgi:EAL domain-containing protein (putative c-di-GMP-specific phosphodiesterase class I)
VDDLERGERYLVNMGGSSTGWDRPLAKLTAAFEQKEFILFSQLIVRLAASPDRRQHFEVFIRLQEEEQNLAPPGTFLPMLEYYSLGPQLDRYVLRNLLDWYRTLRKDDWGLSHLNLCAGTLADQDFCAFVEAECKRKQVGAEYLCFEFPGNEGDYPAGALALARGLKKLGCLISVGATESEGISFRPIKTLQADFLKIGGHLIQQLAQSESAQVEVKTAARACQSFDVQTIGQFVENAPTLNALRKLNINFAQGYGISKPGLLMRPKR